MKLKSTSEGLKAVKVNPHQEFITRYGSDSHTKYNNPEYGRFELHNPALDLTTPMPGNTVFEGVEVWQFRILSEANSGWNTEHENTQQRHDNFDAYTKFWADKNMEFRCCYQPLEVKEQVREEAPMDYDHLPLNNADQQKLYWDANAREKMSKLLGIDNLTEAKPFKAIDEASNPELGVSSEPWTDLEETALNYVVSLYKDNFSEPSLSVQKAFIQGANWQATQQQGLVSLKEVEKVFFRVFDQLEKKKTADNKTTHILSNGAIDLLKIVLDELKTLKQ